MNPGEERVRGLPPFVADERARDISRETAACDAVLRALLGQLGPWAERVVLVGGLSPRYLIPEPPEGIDPHMGTTDIDLVLTLALPAGEAAPEESLAERLHGLGFAPQPEQELPDGPAFRWTRYAQEFKVKVEFMCPARDRPALTIEPDPVPDAGTGLGALRLPGAELVARDYVERPLGGPTLTGEEAAVRLRVTHLLPFLVLKAFALDERQKDKDAYDVVWVLSAYESGPADAARAALRSPVAGEAVVNRAILRLREHFGMREARGPELYAQAFPTREVTKRRALERYAYTTVQQFLRAWDEGRSPAR